MIVAAIRAGLFGGFLVLALFARRSPRARNLFIAWFFMGALVAGISQRDLWPFSGYPIFAEDALRYRESVWIEFRGVASDGSEFRLREDAYAPVMTATVEKWIERHPERLADPAVRQWLMTPGSNRRFLGPLTAGDNLLRRGGVRDEKPASIRVYRHTIGGRTLLAEIR